MVVSKPEAQKHLLVYHSKKTCDCGQATEGIIQFMEHKTSECAMRKVRCAYCMTSYMARLLDDHMILCGIRTEKCWKCQNVIMVKDRNEHFLAFHDMEFKSQPQQQQPPQINEFWANQGAESIPVSSNAASRAHVTVSSDLFANGPHPPKDPFKEFLRSDEPVQKNAETRKDSGKANWDAKATLPPPLARRASQPQLPLSLQNPTASSFPRVASTGNAAGLLLPSVNPATSHMLVAHQQLQPATRMPQRGYASQPQTPSVSMPVPAVMPPPLLSQNPNPSQFQFGNSNQKVNSYSTQQQQQQQQFQQPQQQGQRQYSQTAPSFSPAPQAPMPYGSQYQPPAVPSYSGVPSVFTASKLNTKHRTKAESATSTAANLPTNFSVATTTAAAHAPLVPVPVPVAGPTAPTTASASSTGVGSLGTGKKDRKAVAPNATANLRIRLWDGSELRHEFPASELMSTVVHWVASQPVIQSVGMNADSIALSTTFPFRTFQAEEYDSLNLAAAGLTPRGFLLLKPR